jgi:uncharacterized delta-60 repeat protein
VVKRRALLFLFTAGAALAFACSLVIGDREFGAPADAGPDVAGDVIADVPADASDVDPDRDAYVDAESFVFDPSFGEGGVVVLSPGGQPSEAYGVVANDAGGVVLAGWIARADASSFALVRLTASGDLDPSFGDGGVVKTDIHQSSAAHAIAVQPDGKLVAAGTSYDGSPTTKSWHLAIARYSESGQLDTTFGTSGVAAPDPDNDYVDDGQGVAFDPATSGVVASGLTAHNGGAFEQRVVVVSVNGAGSVNRTKTTTNVEQGYGLIVQNGDAYVAGVSDVAGDAKLRVFKFAGATALDTRYVVNVNASRQYDVARAIGSLGTGYIVAGSAGLDGGSSDMLAARFSNAGQIDTTFGDGGLAVVDLGVREEAHALAVDGARRPILAGASGSRLALVRLTPQGGLDATLLLQVGSSGTARGIAVAPDGSIFVVGGAFVDGRSRMVILKVRP